VWVFESRDVKEKKGDCFPLLLSTVFNLGYKVFKIFTSQPRDVKKKLGDYFPFFILAVRILNYLEDKPAMSRRK